MLARFLGDCGTGTDISRILDSVGIVDTSGESTKWKRLYRIFLVSQAEMKSPNQILSFIQSFLAPARYVGQSETFEGYRIALNSILPFSGLEFGADGQFKRCAVAKTLSEAQKRSRGIQAKFRGRSIHSEVLKYCRSELMHDNYFHAVFEASKGLAQRIRDLSGIDGDGEKLVNAVFSVEHAVLALNTLRTETERSEHKGFAQLLKGCFAAVRNPLAHEPKLLWQGEEDAADYFTLISLLHRKLDKCVRTGR